MYWNGKGQMCEVVLGVVSGRLGRQVEAIVHGEGLPLLQTNMGSVFGG